MKYQSELIKEIVDSRGHKESSLHYESECTETWIEEAKGAYPKLCDYESEWLNYISILDDTGGSEDPEPPIGEFPYVVLSDVTEATIDNVVPDAYKSAILRGDTLVNVVTEQAFGGNDRNYESQFFDSTFNAGETFTIFVVNPRVTTIKVGLNNAATGLWAKEQQYDVNNIKRVVYTVPSGYCCKYVAVVVSRGNDATGFENSLVIVSGDKSYLEIDNYFEGMLSVEMPVLKATGKNLFDGIIEFGGINTNTGLDTTWSTNFRTSFMRVPKNNTNFLFTFNYKGLQMSGGYLIIIYYNENKERILSQTVGNQQPFNFNQDAYYYRITQNIGGNLDILDITNIQLEEGAVATSYEPYKSIILSTPEDLELRGIGDVKDELDCLTGKLTQRIDEDGSALTQEVVRTVDLNIQDQNGKTLSVIKPIEGKMFVSTSGVTIKPLFSGEIPVEAITQNLASFIDLEMEE